MNLDELNTLFASAWSQEEKALMFEGLVRGSNGTVAPESAPGALKDANALGLKWRKEAEDFLAKSAADGLKSVEARRARNGTAQPPSANSRTPFDESSNQATSYKLQADKEQLQETLTPLAGDASGGATEQQPEKAAEHQTEALTPQSVAPTQASDAEQTPEQRTPSPRSARPPSPKAEASAQAITVYEAYPIKVGRGAALPKIEIAIRTHGFEKILEATKAYAEATATWRESDREYIPNPATWFNQQRYLDDRREWFKKSARPMNIPRTGSFGNED